MRVAHYQQPHVSDLIERIQAMTPNWRIVPGAPDETTHVLITGYATDEDLQAAPNLKSLIVPFAGLPPRTRDVMLRYPHITVHNLHHNAPETAEVAIALMLACAKKIVPIDQSLRRNDWTPRYDADLSIRLEGKTAVVIGFGAVGRRIAAVCIGLGMRVIAHKRTPLSEDVIEVRTPERLLDSLREADVVLLAAPQTSETAGLLGPNEIAAMKDGAILVNVARASAVDEGALYESLKSGKLRGAGLDVWYRYPESEATKGYMGFVGAPESAKSTPPSAYPFHELDNVVMSPHRGGTSADVEDARVVALAELLNSDPMGNRVNLERGY